MAAKMMFFVFLLCAFLSDRSFGDVMNLNELTPTLLEDATPVDEKSHVLLISGRFNEAENDELLFRPNYRYGYSDRLQLEAQTDFKSGGNEKGSGQTRLAALYKLNREDKYVPVIAFNPILFLPGGKAEEGIDSQMKFIATSTLRGSSNTPEMQVHLNYAWSNNSQRQSGERKNYSTYALGMSQRVSDSTAAVVDLIRMEQEESGEDWNLFEAGARHAITRNNFFGLGLGAGFGDQSPHWRVILSYELQI